MYMFFCNFAVFSIIMLAESLGMPLTLRLVLDVHLTNVAIQKTAPDYDAEKGCKWSMPQIKRYFTAKHGIENVGALALAVPAFILVFVFFILFCLPS